MNNSQKQLLKKIYDHEQTERSDYELSLRDDSGRNLPDANALMHDVEALERNGYLSIPMSACGWYTLALTPAGNAFVESMVSEPQPPAPTVSINLTGATVNNSMLGNTLSGQDYTVNLGTPLEEIRKLLPTKSAEDQALIHELLSELERLQQSNQPIQRGWLSRFSDLLKKHTDLIAPPATAFLQHVLGR